MKNVFPWSQLKLLCLNVNDCDRPQLLALLSTGPQYSEVVASASLLSPVFYIHHMTSPLHWLAAIGDQVLCCVWYAVVGFSSSYFI